MKLLKSFKQELVKLFDCKMMSIFLKHFLLLTNYIQFTSGQVEKFAHTLEQRCKNMVMLCNQKVYACEQKVYVHLMKKFPNDMKIKVSGCVVLISPSLLLSCLLVQVNSGMSLRLISKK